MKLPKPYHRQALLEFLGGRAIPGVEYADGDVFARLLHLPGGTGAVALTINDEDVAIEVEVSDEADHEVALGMVRRLLDLDRDPVEIDTQLSRDSYLAKQVAIDPGLRLPTQVDGFEAAIRAVIGQQVSVAGARTILGRISAAYGDQVDSKLGARYGLTHAFPRAEQLAEVELTGMPQTKATAVRTIATKVAEGELDLTGDVDIEETKLQLLSIKGIGPWTAGYIAMRGLGAGDEILADDLVIRRMLLDLGLGPGDTVKWSPWRSYAAMHLWRAYARRE